jgi:hypothetical protein
MEVRRLGAELFHAGGRAEGRTDVQTYMTKFTVAFRLFSKAPKNLTSMVRNRLGTRAKSKEQDVYGTDHKKYIFYTRVHNDNTPPPSSANIGEVKLLETNLHKTEFIV